MRTCTICQKEFDHRVKTPQQKQANYRRKTCFDCNPHGISFNLIKRRTQRVIQNNQLRCGKCQKSKDLELFMKDKSATNGYANYCKICGNRQAIERQQLMKKRCTEYLGGQCTICGYKKCLAALDFHHLDPNEKEFQISKFKHYTFDHRVIHELDKCILLCANCHREHHYTEYLREDSNLEPQN